MHIELRAFTFCPNTATELTLEMFYGFFFPFSQKDYFHDTTSSLDEIMYKRLTGYCMGKGLVSSATVLLSFCWVSPKINTGGVSFPKY